MFKVNSKDTGTTLCSSVFIVHFEHVIAGWDWVRRYLVIGTISTR